MTVCKLPAKGIDNKFENTLLDCMTYLQTIINKLKLAARRTKQCILLTLSFEYERWLFKENVTLRDGTEQFILPLDLALSTIKL